jgi:UDP-4-amino-4,6-dideoxy-N-acetyl-beta-L-altrosamine N-acetyltransferase
MAEIHTNDSCLRQMTVEDLESILSLRNHPEIRRYMLTQHVISTEEHTLWFHRASNNPRIDLTVFEEDGRCYGFVQFKETSHPGVVDWGFYVAPDAPKGISRKLGLAALHHAFEKSNLHKICGQVLHWNLPSIEFHKSLGFVQEGVFRNQHFDGVNYHDMIYFGILKHDWSDREDKRKK